MHKERKQRHNIYSQDTKYIHRFANKGTIYTERIQNMQKGSEQEQAVAQCMRKRVSKGKRGHNLCRKGGAGNVVHFASALTPIASFAMLSYCYFLANKGTVKSEGI